MGRIWMFALIAFAVLSFGLTAAAGETEAGFEPIFDGKTLEGWDGDPVYWRAEEGKLVGEVTPDTLLKRNSWIIWRGGTVADFELKLEYRVSAQGNSGVGYRCEEIEGEPYAFRGYQADIHGGDDWTGINYEERGRTFLALRGMATRVPPGDRPELRTVFASEAALQRHVKKEDWNTYHIVARGNRLQHFLNGVLMSEVVDDDPVNGRREGLLGVQVHVGPPMTIEYRNIRLKRLEPDSANAESPAQSPEITFDNPSALKHLREQAAGR